MKSLYHAVAAAGEVLADSRYLESQSLQCRRGVKVGHAVLAKRTIDGESLILAERMKCVRPHQVQCLFPIGNINAALANNAIQ